MLQFKKPLLNTLAKWFAKMNAHYLILCIRRSCAAHNRVIFAPIYIAINHARFWEGLMRAFFGWSPLSKNDVFYDTATCSQCMTLFFKLDSEEVSRKKLLRKRSPTVNILSISAFFYFDISSRHHDPVCYVQIIKKLFNFFLFLVNVSTIEIYLGIG
jgi:hypothetical protein